MADQSRTAGLRPTPVTLRSISTDRRDAVSRSAHVADGFRHPLAPLGSSPALLPLIGVDDDLGPALERVLHPVAVRAQSGDRAARDALYMAFEPKLVRFIWRIRVPFAPDGCRGLWDRDDVTQEAYLAFVGVIESWSPGIPFGRYVLANFPWRLRDAVHRGVGRRGVPPRGYAVPILDSDTIADPASGEDEQRVMIDALAASFEPPLDNLLRLRILEQQTLAKAAKRLGISRRSVNRHWRTILIRMRAEERQHG